MKKPISKRILKVLLIVLITIFSLIVIINIPIITLSHKSSTNDYSNWMSETLENNSKVIDVAMLGAHDAFSNEINIFSELDPYERNGIMQGFTGFLVKGFITKQSLTQISEADTLLKSGIRYLDIRLSYYEETWYTKHNYISGEFEVIAEQITAFLEENAGEFLVLDFQHIDGVDYDDLDDYNTFLQMLERCGLSEFTHVINDLSTLTYGELTNNGDESKVIIITKFEDSAMDILNYEDSIRSIWADSDDFSFVLDFLEEEARDIDSNNVYDRFRIMQAVTTMQMNPPGMINALTTWSLINRAKKFNVYLLESGRLEDILDELPIIMIDYSDTNYQEFNDNIMQIIMDFN